LKGAPCDLNRPKCRRAFGFAGALLLLALIVHAHHYLSKYSDPTVGLYIYIAELWLGGHLPYLAAWEYKPPGLFAYLALALKFTGNNATVAIELLATLSTFVTALLLWRLAQFVDRVGSRFSGRYAALFFVLLAPENEGYNGDSEVLLSPFTAGAYLLACAGSVTLWSTALAGLLAGCALQMKLSVLPIVGLPALVMARKSRYPFAIVAAYAAGALFPFALEAALYASASAMPALVDANLGATFRRSAALRHGVSRENLFRFSAELRVLSPALEFALLASVASVNRRRLASWGWFATALASIAIIGEFYDRQFVLLKAPVALLGGIGLRVALDCIRGRPLTRAWTAAVVILTTFALHDYWETAQAATIAYHRFVLGEPEYREGPYAEIVRALRVFPRSSLFVLQESPLLYYEFGVSSPTRFPYAEHLLDPRMVAMTGVPGRPEVARIFAKKPHIVITGQLGETRFDPMTVELIREYLRRDYYAVATLSSQTRIYVRKSLRAARPRAGPEYHCVYAEAPGGGMTVPVEVPVRHLRSPALHTVDRC